MTVHKVQPRKTHRNTLRRHGYMQFLPRREFLPLMWPEHLLSMAASTRLDIAKARQDLQAMNEDFREIVEAVVGRHPTRFIAGRMTFEAFLAASSLVSSRAFYVDRIHGKVLHTLPRKDPACTIMSRAGSQALAAG
jgi:hypothetical protein